MSMIWTAIALDKSEFETLCQAEDPWEAVGQLEAQDGRSSGLERAWDAAHWLITGGTEVVEGPDGFIKSGGVEVDDLDFGYGPARFLPAETVQKVREMLRWLSREKLEPRWDADALASDEVYPFGHSPISESDQSDVLGHIDDLRKFIDGLSPAQGMLVYLT